MNSRAERPELSVIICTHNGAHGLPTVLASLARQSVAPAQFEVVVVDDGSTDSSLEVAQRHGVRCVRLEPNQGLAAARNAGVSAAAADVVAFTDDDCEVSSNWVAEILTAFGGETVDGLAGRVVARSPSPFVQDFLTVHNPLTPLGVELLASRAFCYRLLMYLRRNLSASEAPGDELYSVVGANMAFRKRLILELGGFDEQFRFGGEEEDLCLRAHLRPGGARLRYHPEAVVEHWFPQQVGDIVRRARAYGSGNARMMLKHSEVRPIIYPIPVLMLLILAFCGWKRLRTGATLALVLPWLGYPQWLWWVARGRRLEPLLYPLLHLAQESATMIGETEGVHAGYTPSENAYLARA